MMKMRIGAIYWDAALPKETYFGGFTLLTLGNKEFSHRLPFFAVENQDGSFDFPDRTQEEYDREFSYAADAGIDFFACCWYPDSPGERPIGVELSPQLTDHLHELNRGRKMFQQSPVNRRMKMCAIVFTSHSYAQSDFEALKEAMAADYYEKTDGKPLVMLFGSYNADFNTFLREKMAEAGFTVHLSLISPTGRESSPDGFATVDSLTAYASCHGGGRFADLTAQTDADNRRRLEHGLSVMPVLSAGWDPSPRIRRRNTWVTYEDIPYAPLPEKEDMEEAFASVGALMEENPDKLVSSTAMVFAWNEFEEGGYLCPTLGEGGIPDTSLADNFREVREKYR